MTILLGLAAEDGVLLVTDSLSQEHFPNGWIKATFGRKINTLGARAAYVVSGSKPAEWAPPADWASLPPGELAARVLAEVELFPEPPRNGRQPGHDVLVAAYGLDGRPGLVLTGSDLALTEARVGGSPLIGGALRDWAEAEGIRFSPAPGTLAAALPFALDCCRRYLRESWAAWGFEKLADFHLNEPGGYCPPSAPPFCVEILTTTELKTLEVSE